MYKLKCDYWAFADSIIQKRLRYKTSFFMKTLGGLLQVFIMCCLWSAVYNSSSSETINNFTKNEMLTYVILTYITSKIIIANVEFTIATDIKDGSIAINLIRPINYFKKLLFEVFGDIIINFITIVLPIWLLTIFYNYLIVGISPPKIGNIVLYIFCSVLGFITLFLLNFLIGLSAFFLTYIWGIMIIKNTILQFISGSLVPFTFLPSVLSNIFKILPFNSLNYLPIMIYMNKISSKELIFQLIIQLIWIILLLLLLNFVWKKAINRLTILGG